MLYIINVLAIVSNLTLAQAQVPAGTQVITPVQQTGTTPNSATLKEESVNTASEAVSVAGHETEGFDLNEVINHHLGDATLLEFSIGRV